LTTDSEKKVLKKNLFTHPVFLKISCCCMPEYFKGWPSVCSMWMYFHMCVIMFVCIVYCSCSVLYAITYVFVRWVIKQSLVFMLFYDLCCWSVIPICDLCYSYIYYEYLYFCRFVIVFSFKMYLSEYCRACKYTRLCHEN